MKTSNGTLNYRRNVTDRLTILEEGADRIEEEQIRTNTRLDQLFKRLDEVVGEFNKRGKPNYVVVLGGIGLFLTACSLGFGMLLAGMSLLWFLVNTQMVNVTNPIKSELAALMAQSNNNTAVINNYLNPRMGEVTAQNARSEQDRKDLNGNLARVGDKVSVLESREVATSNKLQEVETQFSKSDDSHNIQWAQQARHNGQVDDTLNALKAPYPPASKGPWYHPKTTKDGFAP